MGRDFVDCAARELNTSRGTGATFNDAWDNIEPLMGLNAPLARRKSGFGRPF